jgi:hypothetical protein
METDMTQQIQITDCVKQGFRYIRVVAYEANGRGWLYTGLKFNSADPRATKLVTRVRETGTINTAYWSPTHR